MSITINVVYRKEPATDSFSRRVFLVWVLRIPGIHALSALDTFKSWSKTFNEILSS